MTTNATSRPTSRTTSRATGQPARPVALVLALLLAAGAAGLLSGNAHAGGAPWAAPEITLADGFNGVSSHTTLASLRGKAVLLVFWIPICPHCQAAASDIHRLHQTYGPRGLEVIVVTHGKKNYVWRWLQERGYRFGVGFDWTGASAARYGVRMLPGAFLIGKDGTLRASGFGGMDAAITAELQRS